MSAAHWCKAVIEEVVPSVIKSGSLVPPPPVPPTKQQFNFPASQATNPPAPAISLAPQIDPQYMQLYKQMYGSASGTQIKPAISRYFDITSDIFLVTFIFLFKAHLLILMLLHLKRMPLS